MDIKKLPKDQLIGGGTGACAGCNAILGLKLALKVLGKDTIVINSSGCMTLMVLYPHTPFKVPWIHGAIECGGALASGISDAMDYLKKKTTVLVYAGDGATYDIGFQSLSGAAERFDNFLYICYNNSSFGNTGFQKSGATQYGSYTLTTPLGKENPVGNVTPRKNMAKIMVAHGIPYVATACTAYPGDYMDKVAKAAKIRGPRFIDLLTPCTSGWGFDASDAIDIGKAMVETGMWPLYEVENKKLRITHGPKFTELEEAFAKQRRFQHLRAQEIKKIKAMIDEEWRLLKGGYYLEVKEY